MKCNVVRAGKVAWLKIVGWDPLLKNLSTISEGINEWGPTGANSMKTEWTKHSLLQL
jgi:hypothetical protein